MKNNSKLVAIKIMAGEKPKEAYDEKTEAHMAKCPKCGHEWMMGEDSEDDSEEYDEED